MRWLRRTASEPRLVPDLNTSDRRWAVYYGWPSLVNGVGGDCSRAAAEFSAFRVLVLGDGLHDPAHSDHLRTRRIVAELSARGTTLTYGYVDLGVSTSNHSLETLGAVVLAWADLGAGGVMLDDAGTDYGVTRDRLNGALGLLHARNLRAIVNAWDPDDVLDRTVRLRPGDGYLAESFPIGRGRVRPPMEWAGKADRIASARRGRQIDVYAVATGDDLRGDDAFRSKVDYAWWAALLYGFEYVQYTHPGYSAVEPGANVLVPHSVSRAAIGTRYVGPVVHSRDGMRHERRTNAGTIMVELDGEVPRSGFNADVLDP